MQQGWVIPWIRMVGTVSRPQSFTHTAKMAASLKFAGSLIYAVTVWMIAIIEEEPLCTRPLNFNRSKWLSSF